MRFEKFAPFLAEKGFTALQIDLGLPKSAQEMGASTDLLKHFESGEVAVPTRGGMMTNASGPFRTFSQHPPCRDSLPASAIFLQYWLGHRGDVHIIESCDGTSNAKSYPNDVGYTCSTPPY